MTNRTIQTHRNTATNTRRFQDKPRSPQGNWKRSSNRITGSSSEADMEMPLIPYWLGSFLPGVSALLEHHRRQPATSSWGFEEQGTPLESAMVHLLMGDRTASAVELPCHVVDVLSTISSSRSSDVFPESALTQPDLDNRKDDDAGNEEIEMIDWDVRIEPLPARPSEQIQIRFIQGGYRAPRIIDDPED